MFGKKVSRQNWIVLVMAAYASQLMAVMEKERRKVLPSFSVDAHVV